jgi:DNA-binding transcriptional LysR family regulator
MGHSLDDLALLVDAMRAGGVRALARAQGVPRSTVSRRLTRLERGLGMQLTRRRTGALSLSDDAQTSFDRLAQLIDEARELAEELGDRSPEPRGVLRLATTPVFADQVLPRVMAKYFAAHPQVRLELLSSMERADLVTERIDVAIRGGPIEDSTSLTARRLAGLSVGLFASPRYKKRRGLPASVGELAEHDLLLSTTRAAGTQWLLQRGNRQESIRVLGKVHANNQSFLTGLCEHGVGIMRAPLHVVRQQLKRRLLVPVLESTWIRGDVFLVFPLNPPPRTRAFVDLAVKEFGLIDRS